MEQENIRFEKSDLPPYIIKVKVGKDGAPLTPQETLDGYPDWAVSLMKDRYGIKLYNC